MHRCLASALLLVFVVVAVAWPQSQDRQAPPPAVVDTVLPYSEPLSPPGIVTRDRAPLTFSTESGRSNFLTVTFAVAAGFDDNIVPTGGQQISDTSYLFAPGIDFNQTRERWRGAFSYHPGFTVNQHFAERNQSAHSLNADFSYGLSPHATLRVRDTFEKTTSVFSAFSATPRVPGGGSLPAANTSVITPLVERTVNSSGVDLAYRFSLGSIIGAGATYYFTNYGNPAGATGNTTGLIDARSLAADGFYAHRFSNQNWVGATYGFQRLNFSGGTRTDVQHIQLFYALPITVHTTLSVWAGPEHHATFLGALAPVGISPDSRWSIAGGADWGWHGQRASVRAGFTRQISDGGGLAQAVRLQQGSAEARYKLATKWTSSVGISYAVNDPLSSALLQVSKIQAFSGNAGVEYQITNNLGLAMQYARGRQEYPDAVPAIGVVNRNRAMVSLSYSFTRPLGR